MEKIINDIAYYTTVIAIVIGFFQYKFLTKPLKVYCWLILLAFLTDIGNSLLGSRHLNNIWLINSFQFIEFFGFMYLIAGLLNSKKENKWFITASLIYLPLWIYITFFVSDIFHLNEKEKTFKGILIIVLSGYSLIRLSLTTTLLIYHDYRFWLLAAILSYFAVSVFIYATDHLVFLNNESVDQFSWLILVAYTGIFNILTAIGYIWYYRKRNSFTSL